MPVDASIPLSVQPPKFLTVADLMAQQRQQQAFQTGQQLQQSELTTQNLQQQQARQAIAGTQALNEAYAQPGAITTGEGGVPMLDTDKLGAYLASNGQGHLIPQLTKSALELQESATKIKESRAKLADEEADYAGTVGAGAVVKNADGTTTVDPDLLKIGLAHAAQLYGPNSPSAMALQALTADPTKAAAVANHLMQGSNKYRTTAAAETRAGAAQSQAETAAAGLDARKPVLAAQAEAAQRQADATALAAAAKQGPVALQAALSALPYGRAKAFEGVTDPNAILELGMKPAEIATEQRGAATQKETQRHNQVEESQGAARVQQGQEGVSIRRVEADPLGQFGLNPHPAGAPPGAAPGTPTPAGGAVALHGEDYLKTLPAAMQDLIRGMATGRLTAPTAQARSPIAQSQRAALLQYDPDFSEQRAQVRKAFISGKEAANIGANNTAVVHLDQLNDAAQALHNGSFRPGNALYNAVSTLFGGAAPTNFEGIKAALSGEMATALKGNATDTEIKTIKETIDRSSSPEQFQGAVQEGLKILGVKLNTAQERYRAVNPTDSVWSPVLPSAKAVFDKHGLNPTAGPATNITPAGGAPVQYKENDTTYNPQTGQTAVLNKNAKGALEWQIQPSK